MKNKYFFLVLFVFVLSACDSQRAPQATTEWDDPLWQAHYKALKPIQKFSLKGRIGISNSQDSFSSNFRWQQNAFQDFQFRMYGVLGNTYVLMNSKPNWSTLETGDDRFLEGPDASILIAKTMSWTIPLNYLSDWIKGVPTGVGQDQIAINQDGTLQTLNYQGPSTSFEHTYTVSYEKYKVFSGRPMPTKIRITNTLGDKIILSIRSWEL